MFGYNDEVSRKIWLLEKGPPEHCICGKPLNNIEPCPPDGKHEPEPPKPTRKEWEDALNLCKQAIELIHPVLTSEEPCIAYEAWTAAKKLLERNPKEQTEELLAWGIPKELPKPTRKDWEEWIDKMPNLQMRTIADWQMDIKRWFLTMPIVPKE